MKRLLLALTVVGLTLFLAAPAAVVAQELTADDYVAFWTPNVGTWKGTLEIDGQTLPITFRFRISPNKKCILLYHNSDGSEGTQQLQVYDPVAKHEVAWGVDEKGQRQIQTIVVDGMKKGMKMAKGVGGSWELKRFTNDGKTITTTSKWTMTDLDETHMVMVWSDVKEDGTPKPDTKMMLERQPERERRPRY
jgi:hypothetical protein